MKIGVDLDNTIVNYDGVFHQLALEKKWIPDNLDSSKTAVRNYLRKVNQEKRWIELQGEVYGCQMIRASDFPEVVHFFRTSAKKGYQIAIISHRSLFPYAGLPYNLHEAATQWLKDKGLFMNHVELYLETSLENKLARIEKWNSDVFIDDLPEVLSHSLFPSQIEPILFDPKQEHKTKFKTIAAWHELFSLLSI